MTAHPLSRSGFPPLERRAANNQTTGRTQVKSGSCSGSPKGLVHSNRKCVNLLTEKFTNVLVSPVYLLNTGGATKILGSTRSRPH